MDTSTSNANKVALPPSDREVLTELVGLHARVLTRMPLVQFFVVLGLGFVIYPSVPAALFIGWGCLTLSAEGARAAYAIHIRRSGNAIDPTQVHRRLVLLAAAAGGAVAVGAASFLPRLSIQNQAFLALILCVMPAAGVAVANSSQRILGAYALSLLLPTACVWAWVHPNQAVTACSLIIIYCIFLIVVSADGEQLLRRSIIIRNERDQVVKELERSNADVREAMAKAEQSAQARARVLASASHDVNRCTRYRFIAQFSPPTRRPKHCMRSVIISTRSFARSVRCSPACSIFRVCRWVTMLRRHSCFRSTASWPASAMNSNPRRRPSNSR
jgi:hypothetical protein